MKKEFFVILILLLNLVNRLCAQIDVEVDAILNKEVNDTIKAYELMDYSDRIIETNPKTGLEINDKALNILNKSKIKVPPIYFNLNKWIDIKGYYYLGDYFIQENKLDSALNYLLLSLKINDDIGDKKFNCLALHRLGYIEQLNKNYDKAISVYKLSLNYAEELKDLDEISWLHRNIGVLNIYLENYEEAEKYFNLALDDYIKLKNDNYIKVSYYNLANLFNLTGRFDEGILTYNKIIKYVSEKKELAEVYYYISSFYNSLLNYDKALEYSKKSLDIYNEIGEKNAEARILNLLSEIYLSKKDFTKSFECSSKSLKISLETKDSIAIATTLSDIGNYYNELREYDQSIKYYNESQRMFLRLKDFYSAILINNNIALHFFNKGEFTLADEYCNSAISYLENLDDERHWIETLNLKGNILSSKGLVSEALEYYNKALSIANRYNDFKSLSNLYNNIGLLYQSFGDTENSLVNLSKALELSKKLKDKRFLNNVYMNYANSLKDVGKYSEAWKYYLTAWELSEKTNDENSLSVIGQSISNYLIEMGKYEDALRYAQNSLKYDNQFKFKTKVAFDQRLIGVIYKQTGKYSEAVEMFKMSIKTNEEEGVVFEQIRDYINLMQTYFLAENFIESYNQVTKVEDLLHKSILSNFYFLPEKRKAYYIEQFENLNNFLPNLLVKLNSQQKNKLLINIANLRLSFKSLLLDNSTNFKKIDLKGINDETRLEYDQWFSLKQELIDIQQQNNTENKSIELQNKRILVARKKIDSLEFILLKKINERSLKNTQDDPTNCNEIQDNLKTNEVAVEIFRYRKYGLRSRIWIIKDSLKLVPGYTDTVNYIAIIIPPKGKNISYCLMENGNTLENEAYMKYCASTHKPSFYLDTNSFNNYWNRIDSLTNQFKKVFLSADGIYNKINIGAIYNPISKRFILEERDLVLLSSLREICKKPTRESNNKLTATLFGDPKFEIKENQVALSQNIITINDSSVARIGSHPLPATRTEIKQIEEILKGNGYITDCYLGLDANETNVKAIHSPTILHFATHGFFIKDNESKTISFEKSGLNEPLMKSGLLFAGAKNTLEGKSLRSKENGIFFSSEAAEIDLKNTELVVLSACETGNGEVKNGEGVYGLQRAFKMAGARQLIMSMWSIPDNATKELMSEFYKNYILTSDAQISLKKAQIKLMEKYPKLPFYWGAFVVFGN